MQKILFVDDHKAVSESIVFSLSKATAFTFVTAQDLQNAENILIENSDITTAIIDYELGLDLPNGIEVLAALRKIRPNLKALIFSMHTEPLIIAKALKANIQGYVSKDESLAVLKAAVTQVASGQNYFNNAAINVMKNSFASICAIDPENETFFLYECYKELSPKEKEVFALLTKELSIEEIAAQLHKTVKTIKNQRTSIYEKMMIRDRHDLIKAGEKLGL